MPVNVFCLMLEVTSWCWVLVLLFVTAAAYDVQFLDKVCNIDSNFGLKGGEVQIFGFNLDLMLNDFSMGFSILPHLHSSSFNFFSYSFCCLARSLTCQLAWVPVQWLLKFFTIHFPHGWHHTRSSFLFTFG